MILHHKLYHTISMQDTETGQHLATILLHRNSEIFNAHFPGLPILPGACLVQISKECIEENLQQKISITHFKNLKFLKTINPDEFPEITICFSYQKKEERDVASITFSKDESLFCKLEYFFITQ
jgi:3-hydroxyacyl-[acyl-carrier-protein] dehydratase